MRLRALLVAVVVSAGLEGAASGPPAVGPRRGLSSLDIRIESGVDGVLPEGQVFAFEQEFRPGFDRLPSRARTDSHGTAHLAGLRPSHAYSVFAFLPGQEAARVEGIHIAPGLNQLGMEIGRQPRSLKGRVIGPAGEPVPDAEVRLQWPGIASEDLGFWTTPGFDLPASRGTRSDSRGEFVLSPTSEGPWGISAAAAGLRGWRAGVRADGPRIDIRLAPTTTVCATTLSEALLGSAATLTGLGVPLRLESRVDPSGRLEIGGVPPGHYRLSFEAYPVVVPTIVIADRPPEQVQVSVPNVDVPAPLDIRGRVQTNGNPGTPSASVGLFVDEGGLLNLVSQISKADGEGRFVLSVRPHLADRTFRVVAVAGDRAGVSRLFRIGESCEVDLDRPTMALRLRVIDGPSGEPLAGAQIRIISPMVLTQDCTTVADGRMSALTNLLPRDLLGPPRPWRDLSPQQVRLLPGVAEIQIDHPPWHLGHTGVYETGVCEELVVSLGRAPVVEGRVVDRAGRVAVGFRIRTRDGTADTDEDGRFVLICSSAECDHHDLRWAPLPDWGALERLPRLQTGSIANEYVIPDARRWPVELRFPSDCEGQFAQITLKGAPPVLGPIPSPIDAQGLCTPNSLAAGSYCLRLMSRGRIMSETELDLEPEPADGVWRRTIAVPPDKDGDLPGTPR